MQKNLYQDLGMLLEKARAGDKEAFGRFFAKTSEIQYRLILTYVNDPDAAQDILQEVYLTLYQNLSLIRRPQSAIAYLNTTTRQLCMNYRRRVATRNAHMASPTVALSDVTALSLAEQAEQSEQLAQLNHALKKLTPREQQIIVMRYVQRVKIAEIANILDISPATVKRLHRSALEKLRRDMSLPALVPLFCVNRRLRRAPHRAKRKVAAAVGAGVLGCVTAACLAMPVAISGVEVPAGLCPANTPVQVHIDSALPMRQVTLHGPQSDMKMCETAPGVFSAFLPENGQYTVEAISNNGRVAQTSFSVTHIDAQPPTLDAWVEGELTLVRATDENGIDTFSCTSAEGVQQPAAWHINGIWAFCLSDGRYTCTAQDGAGNTADYTLQVRLPQG